MTPDSLISAANGRNSFDFDGKKSTDFENSCPFPGWSND